MSSTDKWGESPLTFWAMTLKTARLCHHYRQTKYSDLNNSVTVYSCRNDVVLFFKINVIEKKNFLLFRNTIKNHKIFFSEKNKN
jgi:hypothetical protein